MKTVPRPRSTKTETPTAPELKPVIFIDKPSYGELVTAAKQVLEIDHPGKYAIQGQMVIDRRGAASHEADFYLTLILK